MTYPIHARLFVVFLVLTLAFSALARSQGVQPVAVPNDAKRSEAGTLVRDIFEDSYAEAKSVMQRREVITKMITTAKATHDDDAARYELLRVGKDLAIQLGDVDLADQAVQSLGAHFQVDKPQLQLELAQKLGAAGKPRSQREEVVSLLEKYYVQAMAAEEYAGADKYAALGADVSTGLRSPDLERWTQRGKTASSLEERYQKVRTAMQKLAAAPGDTQVRLLVGEYLCLVRGNWAEGLPLLSQGGDGEICKAARLDLSPEADPVDIGDAWWDLAEKLTGMDADACRRRADYWYAKALPEATGLTQIRIRKRREELMAVNVPEWLNSPVAVADAAIPEPAEQVDDQPLLQDVIAAYSFGRSDMFPEDTARNVTKVKDLSPNHIDGDVQGLSVVDGVAGTALDAEHDADVIHLKGLDSKHFRDLQSLTIACWLKKSNPGIVFDIGQDWNRIHISESAFAIGMWDRGIKAPRIPANGEWYHLVGTWDGDTQRLFVNGVEVAAKPLRIDQLAHVSFDENPARLFQQAKTKSRSGRSFTGAIDEFLLAGRALSGDEVKKLYEMGKNGRGLTDFFR